MQSVHHNGDAFVLAAVARRQQVVEHSREVGAEGLPTGVGQVALSTQCFRGSMPFRVELDFTRDAL